MVRPPVSRWARTAHRGTAVAAHSRRAMALVLAAMSASAGAISLLTFLAPRDPVAGDTFEVVGTLSALVAAGALLLLRHRLGERLPVPLVHGWIAVSSVMICVGTWSAPTLQMAVASMGFLVWMGLFAGHFFSTRQVAAHLAWMGGCLAVLVAVDGERASATVGIMVFGIVVAAATASHYLSITIRRMAVTDPLTGLPNRQALDELIEREVSRSERSGLPLAAGIVDVDRFKEINDRDGHIAGDGLLATVAANWRQGLRAVDVLARFGGDEFVVLMPGCTLDDAASAFDRLRLTAGHPCSVGVSAWAPGDTAASLLVRVDRALYLAKDAGRDQVVALPADGGAEVGGALAC